jgi:crotonobetainyl-CoA:carnitine CoA-transferase CaiB-like acyl-CoA transferase
LGCAPRDGTRLREKRFLRNRLLRDHLAMTAVQGPLSGIVVLDLGQVYQGPYASLLLAQAGATVVKVEPPSGEPLRTRELSGRKTLPAMATLNQHKRAITLNLKHPRGCELLVALARKADVLVENYAPGVMDRLGVGASVLMAANPRLIYATGTGYGLSGPDRDHLALDFTVQAASGAMSVTGFPGGPPVKAGPTWIDFLSGTHLYAGVMTALFERERTGRGRVVEIAMLDTAIHTVASQLEWVYDRDEAPPRVGNQQGSFMLTPYNAYATQDGGWIVLLCLTEPHWKNLCDAMERPELVSDERYRTTPRRLKRRAEVDALVSDWCARFPRDELAEKLRAAKVPSAPVRDVKEALHRAHLHERGALEWFEHPSLGRIALPQSPIRLHGVAPARGALNPKLGEHNREIFGEWLGLAAAEIEALAREGAI